MIALCTYIIFLKLREIDLPKNPRLLKIDAEQREFKIRQFFSKQPTLDS